MRVQMFSVQIFYMHAWLGTNTHTLCTIGLQRTMSSLSVFRLTYMYLLAQNNVGQWQLSNYKMVTRTLKSISIGH